MDKELTRDLQRKRENANREAEKHRNTRDGYNDKTKHWVQTRDRLNAEVRKHIDAANANRAKRDELNQQVRDAKKDRDEWNRKVNIASEQLGELKKEKMPKGGISLTRLKRDLRMLEFKQQTQVLKPKEEKQLIETLKDLMLQVRDREALLNDDPEIVAATETMRTVKDQAEEFHAKVSACAEQSQAEHDKMVKLYEKGDNIRKEADNAQAQFLRFKKLADEAHQNHINLIREIHDYDKLLHGISTKDGEIGLGTAKERAAEIYEQFKQGGKLSTDDLLLLQHSGYL